MKRYANTLLQRKRAEFESSSESGRAPSDDRAAMLTVEVKDGYDWLQMLGQNHEHRAPAH